jgi:hypothetical protein
MFLIVAGMLLSARHLTTSSSRVVSQLVVAVNLGTLGSVRGAAVDAGLVGCASDFSLLLGDVLVDIDTGLLLVDGLT